MKKQIRALLLITLVFCLAFLSACYNDKPPDNGTPWPEDLNGVFTSGKDSLTFNGDGKSIVLELSEETAKTTGLPGGRTEGAYVFLIQKGSWRYDLSETFRIILGETNYNFRNRIGETSGELIAFETYDGDQFFFRKN